MQTLRLSLRCSNGKLKNYMMEALIKGIFSSNYPDGVKIRVLKSIKKSAPRTLAQETFEQKEKAIYVCLMYIFDGNDFENREAKVLFEVILSHCLEVIGQIFSTSVIEELLDGIWKSKYPYSISNEENEIYIVPNIPIVKRVTVFSCLLCQEMEEPTLHQQIFLSVQTEAIKLLYSCHDHSSFAQVCHFLTRHTDCMPPLSKGFALCTLAIHAMSDYQYTGEIDNVGSYIKDVAHISGLLQYVWNAEPATLIPSLKEIFNIISSSTINTEPSNALGCLVELIPLKLTHTVVQQIVQDTSIPDANMYLALTRMLSWLAWPTAKQAHIWILRFFYELALVSKFSMLADVTHKCIKQVFACISIPNVRNASIAVFSHMLMNYRASPDAFHSVLPDITKLIKFLEDENNPEVNDPHIRLLVNLCHCMMHVHSGFPELYGPLLQALQKFPKPSPAEIRSALKSSSWGTGAVSVMHYEIDYKLDVRSADTDRAGLANLGNTCYMNSILQALFAAPEFRNSLLKVASNLPLQSVTRFLENTFGFLLLTKRMAFEPKEMVKFSRPPWFVAGAQQDCSEYLKYLLDQLHEEQKRHLRRSSVSDTSMEIEQTSPPTTSRLCADETQPKAQALNNTSSTTISKFFHGKQRTAITCDTCRVCSAREEIFVDIALPLDGVQEQNPVTGLGGCVTTGREPGSRNSDRNSAQSRSSREEETDKEDEVAASLSEYLKSDDGFHAFPVQAEDDASEEIYDVTATPRRKHDLKSLLRGYLAQEQMDGDNRYFCNNCNQLQNASKTTHITFLPLFFVITLMRFTYDKKEKRRTKILDNVQIALEIDVPHHQGATESSHKYKLWAVVVHSGTSAESGHYYCYARSLRSDDDDDGDDQSKWFLFNDSHVTPTTFTSLKELLGRFLRDTAYVLMYRKADVDAFADEVVADSRQLINRDLLRKIEADNEIFMKDVELSKKRAKNNSSNFRTWDPNKKPPPPPPPSCGGGDGGHLKSTPMVF